MLANDRYNKISEILDRNGSVKSSQLVTILGVSLETIRRDLDFLEKQGILEKVHGGAIKKGKKNEDVLTYSLREEKNIEEKQETARIAVKLINDNEIIALNSSTTNLEIARLIKNKFEALTIITNSLSIANELTSDAGIHLILAGGIYNKDEFAFLGEITAEFLNKFSVDKAFISVGGISLKRGITDFLMAEVLVERKMMEMAEQVIVLADSSKLEVNSLIKTCDLSDVDLIITDSKLDNNIKSEYLENGVRIVNLDNL